MLCLIVRCGNYKCGLRIEHVVETMRPLPVQSIKSAPAFVSGSSLVRGQILPVVSLTRIIAANSPEPAQRFVVIRTGDRQAVLAVEEVIGVRQVDDSAVTSMPPLLREESHRPVIDMLARLDRELLLILQEAQLIPEEFWAALPR